MLGYDWRHKLDKDAVIEKPGLANETNLDLYRMGN